MLARPGLRLQPPGPGCHLPRANSVHSAVTVWCRMGRRLIYVRLTLPCHDPRRAMRSAQGTQPRDGWNGIPGHSGRLHRLVRGPQRAQAALLLQVELTSQLARLSRLQDEIEDLRRRRPEAPRPEAAPVPEAPAAARQVPEVPAVAARRRPWRPRRPSRSRRPQSRLHRYPRSWRQLPRPPRQAPRWRSGSARAGRCGSAASRWRSAVCCWCAISIEQGIFGPGVRIALGALFALALIAVGEWFRRTERGLPVEAIPAAHVPSILTAAGTVSAFGTVYAAHALYHFIDPAAAFVLLGIIGVATMLAAALHGPALAGLGLAGSLLVPMLVSSQTPSPWPLVIYLAVVAAAAYALARFRRWLWLAAAVVVGVFFWGLALVGEVGSSMAGGWASALFVHVGLQLALAAAFIALEPHLATRDEDATPDWIATARIGGAVDARGAGLGRGPLRHAVDDFRRRRHGDPGAHLLAQRPRCGSRGSGRLRLARRHRDLAGADGGPRAAPAGAGDGRGAAASPTTSRAS